MDQLEPGNPIYIIHWSLRVTGALRVDILEKSINEIVRRHQVLRTTFDMREGQPVQVIAPSFHVPLPTVDLSHLAESDRQSEACRQAEAEIRRPMDLHQGPLVRTLVLKLAELDHVLLLSTHHIIFDDWSIGILLHELAAYISHSLLESRRHWASYRFSILTLPVGSTYSKERIWRGCFLTGSASWQTLLTASNCLPTGRAHPSKVSDAHSTCVDKELAEDLKALSRREGVTLFMTLVAALQTLLCRYSGQEDVVIGTPIANRSRTEVRGLIGFFASTLALRTDLSRNPSFVELLRRVKEVVLGAYAHKDMPFEKLVEALGSERGSSHKPLLQVLFSFQDAPYQSFQLKD